MGVWSGKTDMQTKNSAVADNDFIVSKSVIGETILINGEIESEEEILIEGKIEGFVKSKGLVVVGKSGVVDAEIDAFDVIVLGKVNGNVSGVNKVEIKPDGEVNGNIVSQRVVLAEGSIFKGSIDMSSREK
jgi:cytoskeletal protein CcmA (bactofilin family)